MVFRSGPDGFSSFCRVALAVLLLGPLAARAGDAPASTVPASTAPAQPAPAHVRFAVHDQFDRLVIPLAPGATYATRQMGDALVLTLLGNGPVQGSVAGHRVSGLSATGNQVRVQVAAGNVAHAYRLGDRLVVDVSAAPGAPAAPLASAAPPAKPKAAVKPPKIIKGKAAVTALAAGPSAPAKLPNLQKPSGRGKAPVQQPMQPPIADSAVQASPLPPPGAPSIHLDTPPEPNAALALAQPAPPASNGGGAVTVVPQDSGTGNPAILIPMARNVGAAAYLRAGDAHIVFDVAQPLDLGQLKDDPVFGGVTARLLTDGLHVRLHLQPGQQIRLRRVEFGWVIAVPQEPVSLLAIGSSAKKGVLSLAANQPGHVVVVDDEPTGGRLLVGTQRIEGQRMAASHRSAEFALLPSYQGVVVEPLSDRILLKPVISGFELRSTAPGGLSLLWQDAAAGSVSEGRAMTRVLDFSDDTPTDMHRKLTQALRDAALTPRLARYAPRLRVAEAMLAQGMDAEATAVLQTATADDPSHPNDSRAAWLAAIAAWLTARTGNSAAPPLGFDPALLGDSDEALLWRALFAADAPDPSVPAAAVAAAWPLLLDYAPALRKRMLPDAAALLARGGKDQALAELLTSFPDQSLDSVRAGLLERQGRTDDALVLLDNISHRPDRWQRAEAMLAATELRLAHHKIDAMTAADQLTKQFYAWRGAGRELKLRLRVAELRAQAGAWRQALAALKQADANFPEAHDHIHDLQIKLIEALLRGTPAKLSALDLVSLAEEAEPMLSAADVDSTLAPVLVDKLMALDLPGRAEPILRHLYVDAHDPVMRAGYGAALASVVADRGDYAAALGVLGTSEPAGLDAKLALRRALLRARLLAQTGHAADGLALLKPLPDAESLLLQTQICEDTHDWAQASSILRRYLQTLPSPVSPDLVLRLARDESEAGDMAGLRELRAAHGKEFAAGPSSQLFAVLTAEPVQTVSDLPRSARELETIRALPTSLQAH